MAMGIVSDDDFQRELGKHPEATSPTIKPLHNGGRNNGDINVPESLRKVLGETAQTEGRRAALNLAMQLGISESSVAAYSNGANSTAEYGAPKSSDLRTHVKSAQQRIAAKARTKLSHTLNAITPEKLQSAKLRDLAGVATAMASVVKTMEPTTQVEDEDSVKRATVVIFAPRVRREEEYETITINE